MEARNVFRLMAVLLGGNHWADRISSFWIHRKHVIFLIYHAIIQDNEDVEATITVRESAFRRQMAYLKENYECVSIDKALAPAQNSEGLRIVVTFDDGYKNNFETALPILEQYEIPATIYVTTRSVSERRLLWSDKIWIAAKKAAVSKIQFNGIEGLREQYVLDEADEKWQRQVHLLTEDIKRMPPTRKEEVANFVVRRFQELSVNPFQLDVENNVFAPLTVQQIRQLSSHHLITIGAHSHCHNLLNRLSLEQAQESIVKSKQMLEDITSKQVRHFSYPNGNLTPEIVDILKRTGFESAVTVPSGFFRAGDDPYRIPRNMIGMYTSFNIFKAKLTGIFEAAKYIGF